MILVNNFLSKYFYKQIWSKPNPMKIISKEKKVISRNDLYHKLVGNKTYIFKSRYEFKINIAVVFTEN